MEPEQYTVNDQWVNKIKQKEKIPKTNGNENRTYKNPWDTAKAALRGKCIAMSACI
jgi:hypothetical protein